VFEAREQELHRLDWNGMLNSLKGYLLRDKWISHYQYLCSERITEWSVVEGTLQTMLFQPHTRVCIIRRIHQPREGGGRKSYMQREVKPLKLRRASQHTHTGVTRF